MTSTPYQTSTGPDIESAAPPLARVHIYVFTHVLISAGLGAAFVVSILPFNFVILMIWIVGVVIASRGHFTVHRPNFRYSPLGIQSFVMLAIIVAAHLAPVKITDYYLSRSLTLPETSMTLVELQERSDLYGREFFPTIVSITVPRGEEACVVQFPRREMTLRQFVTAIEEQSCLRHRFCHCGNGWTVLWGGDCSFGLRLRDPERS